jgi:multiple sugar transport system ATP-binding protein
MDEPLSNLDAKLRVQMRTEISKLHQQLRTTTIYVTHDQTEALTMGDRIVVMKDGIIQQVGTPTEIYQNPVNQFVAGFIGSPEMNFISGFLKGSEENAIFTVGEHQFQIPQGKLSALRNYLNADTPIIMGVRPEEIHDEPLFIESAPNSTFTANIEVVENMGAEFYLYLSGIGDKLLTARVNTRFTYAPRTSVTLAVDMNKAHFFDNQTQKCLV